MRPILLAEAVLEVAWYMPDINGKISRAEWRWKVVEKALKIIEEKNITLYTEDLDEVISEYFSREQELS